MKISVNHIKNTLLNESKVIDYQYQVRDIGGNDVYYKKNKNSKYWKFIDKKEFDKKANKKNTIEFKKCKCKKCDWEWVIESDDKHPFLCHKCGFDNKLNKFDKKSLKKWKMNNKPYTEERNDNIIRRTFSENVDEHELTWHKDKKDRIVIPINENDWLVQFDNELPIKLNVDEEFFIPKNTFHRVIKGKSDLVVEIIETTFEEDEYDVYEILEESGKKKKKKKDACYYKVRSRYDVWPSAYASGALVKCRKVGAKNWGNSTDESVKDKLEIHETKKTDFSKEKEEGLHGWFARQGGKGKSKGWVDCNTCRKDPETGRKKCKSCGRKEGEDRAKYPACRPTPASCGTKGKGKKWGKKSLKESIWDINPKVLKN